jgi:hypothetical protein
VDLLWGGPPPEREDYPADDEGFLAWADDGGLDDEVDFALRAEGVVDGVPVEVVAHYGRDPYSGQLTVNVTLDGRSTPEVLCGWFD